MTVEVLFTNATDERVMYHGLGIAPHSFLIFDPRLTPPYQVKPLQGFPVRSVPVDESYDDIIRAMTDD